MKRLLTSLALIVLPMASIGSSLEATHALAPGATAVANWSTSSGNTVNGTLDGVSVTLTASTSALTLDTCNFSDSSKFAHPAGAAEDCYDFSANSILTFTFGSPVTNPELYFIYLRSDASPYALSFTGGSGTASVLSGMTSGSASNTTITQSSGFGTGIVTITGTVTGITITSNAVGTQNYSHALLSIGRTAPAAASTTTVQSSTSSTVSSAGGAATATTIPRSSRSTTTTTAGNGATTSTSSTTTTTTTTIPAPTAPDVDPGEGIVTIDEADISATVTREQNALTSTAGGITTTLSVTQSDGAQRPLDLDGSVVMMKDDTLNVKTTGLAPDAKTDLWLYPGGLRLDTTSADGNGTASSKVPVPAGLKVGKYKVSVSSVNPEDKPVLSTVGLLMTKEPSESSMWWIWLLIGFAVLMALLVPTTLRRRRRRLQ